MSFQTGQFFYKRKSDGALIPINFGPQGPQGETGEKGEKGDPGPAVAEGGITQVDADARYINAAGDTMTGDLVLANEPSADDHPATKGYVDRTFQDSPPVNMPTTYGEEEAAAGSPVDDPSQSTDVHALPYPAPGDGLRVQRALELLALTLDGAIPYIVAGDDLPPDPSSLPENAIYLQREPDTFRGL